jgi:hypothetical protein
MASIPTSEVPLEAVEQRGWESFGYTGGNVTGLAAVVLSIIGLAGVAGTDMAAISAIVLGAGMLLEGGVAVAALSRLRSYQPAPRSATTAAVGGGISAEALAGVATIVLGALSLIGVVPLILTSIAAIVLGAGLLLNGGVLSRLNTMKIETRVYDPLASTRAVTYDAIKTTADAEVTNAMDAVFGVAAIVLGILALVGIVPAVLSLVALLVLGAGTMIGGVFGNA